MEGYNNIKNILKGVEIELLNLYKNYKYIHFYYTKSGWVQIVCFPNLYKTYEIYTIKYFKNLNKETIKEGFINKINKC